MRSVSRPCDASNPAVALPLLYSMMSGPWSELMIIPVFCWICSKALRSKSTCTFGCSALKISIAFSQAIPMAPLALS